MDDSVVILKRIWLLTPERSFWQNDMTGERTPFQTKNVLVDLQNQGYTLKGQSSYFGKFNTESEEHAEVIVYTLARSKVI